jgi:hypothetical protein
MSAEHEKAPALSNYHHPTPLNDAALQAGMHAFQSDSIDSPRLDRLKT